MTHYTTSIFDFNINQLENLAQNLLTSYRGPDLLGLWTHRFSTLESWSAGQDDGRVKDFLNLQWLKIGFRASIFYQNRSDIFSTYHRTLKILRWTWSIEIIIQCIVMSTPTCINKEYKINYSILVQRCIFIHSMNKRRQLLA